MNRFRRTLSNASVVPIKFLRSSSLSSLARAEIHRRIAPGTFARY
jgi:hypothetical protein